MAVLAFECTLSVNYDQNNFTHFLVCFNVLTRENKSVVKTITKVTLKSVIKLGKMPICLDDQALCLVYCWYYVIWSNPPVLHVTLLFWEIVSRLPEICRFEQNMSKFSKFWCFNCVYIEILPVFAVIHLRFCKVCAEKWQNYNILKIPHNAFSGLNGVLKSKISPSLATMVQP